MPRLFEQTQDNNPNTADRLGFGRSGQTTRNITFANFLSWLRSNFTASESQVGGAEIANQTETDAGVDDTRFVTPLKLANYPGFTGGLLTSVINIGDWDMDTDAQTTVAHGVTGSNIRSMDVIIRNDFDNAYLPLNHGTLDGTSIAGSYDWTSTTVFLDRVTGGEFDNTNFDSTSFNRGWIVIKYVL
jgi:hypothetical protein